MSKIVITPECGTIVIDTLKADNGVQKKWKKAADMLRAEGVTSDILSNDKEMRDYFKRDVVLLSFTKVEQAIYNKPTTALSDEEKVTKRFVTTEMGSRLGKVIRHVAAAEKEA